MIEASPRVLVGIVGAPHGVRGELRIKSFTEEAGALADYTPLETKAGRLLRIRSARAQKDMLVVRFEGIDDRDAAAALTGTELFVPRDRLPDVVEEDAFYHTDLIGLTVEDAAGETLGTILGVVNFGAGDLLDIQPAGGGQSVHLPFTKAFVPVLDLAAGRVVAAPPAGLFDAEDEAEAGPG